MEESLKSLESLEHVAENILKENLKNIELISYFCKSTSKIPVFLSCIQRNYAEIKPLIRLGLVKDLKPVKSYEFHIDKFENFFYQKYQETIDLLKDEIWMRKRKKAELVEIIENMVPAEESKDFDQKLSECLDFARKSIKELDDMEMEKEDFNNVVGELQEKMQNDPLYKFLLFVRNDKGIIFNKRTEDNEGVIHKKILGCFNKCKAEQGKEWNFFTVLKKNGFYKEYSPAKNYFITDLGLCVDSKLRDLKWAQDEDYHKSEEEIAQEEEFNKLKQLVGF